MWRVMHRVALRQGKQTCRTLVSAHSSCCYSLDCLRNGHHFHRSGSLGQFHRWSSSVPVGAEPFLSGSSGSYVEAMYESWQKDRNSVHKVTSCYQTLILYLYWVYCGGLNYVHNMCGMVASARYSYLLDLPYAGRVVPVMAEVITMHVIISYKGSIGCFDVADLKQITYR